MIMSEKAQAHTAASKINSVREQKEISLKYLFWRWLQSKYKSSGILAKHTDNQYLQTEKTVEQW